MAAQKAQTLGPSTVPLRVVNWDAQRELIKAGTKALHWAA